MKIPTYLAPVSLLLFIAQLTYISRRDPPAPLLYDRATTLPSVINSRFFHLPDSPPDNEHSAPNVESRPRSVAPPSATTDLAAESAALWSLLTATEREAILAGLDLGTPLIVLIANEDERQLLAGDLVSYADNILTLATGTTSSHQVVAIQIGR